MDAWNRLKQGGLAKALDDVEQAIDRLVAEADQHGLTMALLGKHAAEELRQRRHREALLGKPLFADPSWDILLDLFVSFAIGRPVTISKICLAGVVPTTTTLRYIKALMEAGYVSRKPDLTDARRVLLNLTEDGQQKMIEYLRSKQNNGPLRLSY